MIYEFWANATAVTHATIILAVIIGLLVCFRYKRFRPFEAGALVLIVVLWSYYGNCPLTILEEHFHVLAGKPTGITNIGFLPYYANKLFGLAFSSKLVQDTTFFTGGTIFTASIEWLSPVFHFHVFSMRKTFRKTMRKLGKRFAF